jgi:hypothetical protein
MAWCFPAPRRLQIILYHIYTIYITFWFQTDFEEDCPVIRVERLYLRCWVPLAVL